MTTSSKKVEIISAALKVFSTHGYNGASLSAIAKIANTNKQLITHHFGSKQNLWQETVDYELRDGIELLKRVKKTDSLQGPEIALKQFIDSYVKWISNKNATHRLMMLENQVDSPRLEWFQTQHVLPSAKLVMRLIKRCQKLGVVKPGDCGRLYFTLLHLPIAPLIGARQYESFVGCKPFEQSEIEYHRQTMLDFLGVQ